MAVSSVVCFILLLVLENGYISHYREKLRSREPVSHVDTRDEQVLAEKNIVGMNVARLRALGIDCYG